MRRRSWRVKLGGQLDFPQKALAAQLGRDIRPEHLERHLPLVPQIDSEIDRGHSAPTELPLDSVAVVHSLWKGGSRGIHTAPRPGMKV